MVHDKNTYLYCFLLISACQLQVFIQHRNLENKNFLKASVSAITHPYFGVAAATASRPVSVETHSSQGIFRSFHHMLFIYLIYLYFLYIYTLIYINFIFSYIFSPYVMQLSFCVNMKTFHVKKYRSLSSFSMVSERFVTWLNHDRYNYSLLIGIGVDLIYWIKTKLSINAYASQ